MRREGVGQLEDGQILGAWKRQEWEQYKSNLHPFQHLIFEFQMRLNFLKSHQRSLIKYILNHPVYNIKVIRPLKHNSMCKSE